MIINELPNDDKLKEVMARLPEYLDMSKVVSMEITDIERDNGIKARGIRVTYSHTRITPCIFVTQSILTEPADRAARKAAKNLEKRLAAAMELLEMDEVQNHWKDRTFLCLLNFDQNKDKLKDCIYRRFFDLAMVVRWHLPLDYDGGTMLVERSLLKDLDVTEEALFEAARENTRKLFSLELEPLDDYLNRIVPHPKVENLLPIHLLTHSARSYGAVVITYEDVLERVEEKLQDSFYIVPSSVHEVLALPDSLGLDEELIRNILLSINDETLDKSEVLSYMIYHYDRNVKKLTPIQ